MKGKCSIEIRSDSLSTLNLNDRKFHLTKASKLRLLAIRIVYLKFIYFFVSLDEHHPSITLELNDKDTNKNETISYLTLTVL